jgi:hypothetical protein
MSCLQEYKPISRADLHDMSRIEWSTEKRVKEARFEYSQRVKRCTKDLQKYNLVCELAKNGTLEKKLYSSIINLPNNTPYNIVLPK